MRQRIVAGNWKMNGTAASNALLLGKLRQGLPSRLETQIIVCPPYPYLSQAASLLAGSKIALGAQNMSAYEPGAYTGEVAADMLKDLGCRYVILGHSERRQLYNEDNVAVALKFSQAKKHGLIPIFCVGETMQQRKDKQTETVVTAQLEAVLNLADGVAGLRNAVIAYEPIWAIGTGMTASAEQAQTVQHMLREKVTSLDPVIAAELPILYGGSVKPDNAAELFAMPDIDGGLIGGASLDASQFVEIVKCTQL